ASLTRLAVELERNGHLADRAIGAHGEHDLRVELEVLAGRHVEIGRWPAQVAELRAVPHRKLGQLRIVGEELVQAVLDIETLGDAGADQVSPGRREAASLGRDPHERRGRVEAERVVDRAYYRYAVLCLSRAGGVEDRHRRVLRVAEYAARRLPVVRVARLALSEDQVPLHRETCSALRRRL